MLISESYFIIIFLFFISLSTFRHASFSFILRMTNLKLNCKELLLPKYLRAVQTREPNTVCNSGLEFALTIISSSLTSLHSVNEVWLYSMFRKLVTN